MNIDRAYEILGLTARNTEAERGAAYDRLRATLESKLGKAPTAGLKEKYRNALAQVDEAIETIEDSVDGGELPSVSARAETPATSPRVQSASGVPPTAESRPPAPATAGRSRAKELVALLLVVAALGAGGWWYWQDQAQTNRESAAVENFMVNVVAGWTEEVSLALQSRRPLDVNQVEEKGDTALHIAAKLGYSEIVADLLQRRDIHVNKEDATGATAIMMAVVKKQTACVRLLAADSRVDTNARNPLAVACYRGNLDATKLLIARSDTKVNQTERDAEGYGVSSPLHNAIAEGHPSVVALLLSRRDLGLGGNLRGSRSPPENSLAFACSQEQWEIAMLLAKDDRTKVETTSGDAGFALNAAWKNGRFDLAEVILGRFPGLEIKMEAFRKLQLDLFPSALYFACHFEELDLIRMLLAANNVSESLNYSSKIAPGILMQACMNRQAEIVKLLVAHPETDPNIYDAGKKGTPLMASCVNGLVELVRILLTHPRVDLQAKNPYGYSVLDQAITATDGRMSEVLMLLAADPRFDINQRGEFGATTLQALAVRGDAQAVSKLLARKDIDVNRWSNKTGSALELALAARKFDVARLLLSHRDIEVNILAADGVKYGISVFYRLILEKGSDLRAISLLLAHPNLRVNAGIQNGMTPLMLACGNGHEDVVRALLARKDIDVSYRHHSSGTALTHAKPHPRIVAMLKARAAKEADNKR